MQGGAHGSQQLGFFHSHPLIMRDGLQQCLDELFLGRRHQRVETTERQVELLRPVGIRGADGRCLGNSEASTGNNAASTATAITANTKGATSCRDNRRDSL